MGRATPRAVPEGGAKEAIKASPNIAGQLGIFDCSGVSDGAAAAIICRAEDVQKYTDKPLYVKALSFAAGPATGPIDPDYDYTSFERSCVGSAAYSQAGVTDPRLEIAMAEVMTASRDGARPDGGPRVRRAGQGGRTC